MFFKVIESATENDVLTVKVRGWEGDESTPIILIEDVIMIDRKDIIKEELINAILNGVQISETLHYTFSPDEVSVQIAEDGIKINITPIRENSVTAVQALAQKINDRLIKLSRSMTTIAINRINMKAGMMKKENSPFDAEDKETLKNEMELAVKQRRLAVFAKRREMNIPEDKFREACVRLTGKESSAEWTWEDINKISQEFKMGV